MLATVDVAVIRTTILLLGVLIAACVFGIAYDYFRSRLG